MSFCLTQKLWQERRKTCNLLCILHKVSKVYFFKQRIIHFSSFTAIIFFLNLEHVWLVKCLSEAIWTKSFLDGMASWKNGWAALPVPDMCEIGHVRYINIVTWLCSFQNKLLYWMMFSTYPSLFWELWDKINLKEFQFWPESLGFKLEYWYIECALFITNLRCVQLGHFSFKDTLQSLNVTLKVAEKLMNVMILRIFKTLRARFFNKIQDWILTCKSERILKWILQNGFFGSFDTDHHRKCKIHLRILPV